MKNRSLFGIYAACLMFVFTAMLFSCKSAKLSDAEEKQRIGEYYSAAQIYRKIYAKTPPDKRDVRSYVAYRMAECYRHINNVPAALSGYMNAVRYNYPDSIIYLRLGQMSQENGQYPSAIKDYQIYLERFPKDQLAVNGLKGCEAATEWKQNPTRYIVHRMEKFNSRRGEFSPMLAGEKFDELYFASSRTPKKKVEPKDKTQNTSTDGNSMNNPSSSQQVVDDSKSAITGLRNNDLFVVRQNEKGQWQAPEMLADPVNTEFDEGTPTFSSDGKTMYYTYCAQDPEGSRPAEIYVSQRSGAAWGKGTRTTLLKDSVTSIGHPSLCPNGKYLYLVTNLPGGYGGKDIYRARVAGPDFGPLENLGPEINTAGDEMFPYSRDSVTLYFASNGHPGMGGLDLFKATLDSLGHWQVENMKSPINSMSDDFGITFAGKRESGFFSSNRNDARGYDHIYSFEKPTVNIFIEGYVSDADEEPITGATVRIVGKDGLNAKAVTRNDGSYRVELERDISYVMMASAKGYLNQNFELHTGPEEENETYNVDFFLSPIFKPVVIDNIFYDFDKATLRPESKKALDGMIKIMKENPNVTIELGAHTDRIGTVEYNEDLAQRRAQSVVDYLIKNGINKDRMTAKGYGKNTPKTVTKKIAEKYDFLHEGDVLNEEFVGKLTVEQQAIADQINRRTEFRVLSMDYNLF